MAKKHLLPGEEHWVHILRPSGEWIHYRCMSQDGAKFECNAKTLEEARKRRDAWLKQQGKEM